MILKGTVIFRLDLVFFSIRAFVVFLKVLGLFFADLREFENVSGFFFFFRLEDVVCGSD